MSIYKGMREQQRKQAQSWDFIITICHTKTCTPQQKNIETRFGNPVT